MRIVNKNVFVTIDGKEFDTEEEANEHEIDLLKPRVYLVIEQIDRLETIKYATCCSSTAATIMSALKKKHQDYPEFSYRVKNLILDEEL